MKIIIIQGSHWSTPNVRIAAAFTQEGADAEALKMVNLLRTESEMPAARLPADWRKAATDLYRHRIAQASGQPYRDLAEIAPGWDEEELAEAADCYVWTSEIDIADAGPVAPLPALPTVGDLRAAAYYLCRSVRGTSYEAQAVQVHDAIATYLPQDSDTTLDQVLGRAAAPRVLISIDGGLITQVASDIALDVFTVDFDTDGLDYEQDATFTMNGTGAGMGDAYRKSTEAWVDSSIIDKALAAPLWIDRDYGESETVQRWLNATAPDAREGEQTRHVSAFFAFEGELEAVSGLIPSLSTTEAMTRMSDAISAVFGQDEVSKMDITCHEPAPVAPTTNQEA